MNNNSTYRSGVFYFVVIVSAYLVCHGLTTFIIAPVQTYLLRDITMFASLMYLPHGIRVLSTMLMGWRAIPPLFVGNYVSAYLFTDASASELMEPVLFQSLLVGATSAFLAFEVFRLTGNSVYGKVSKRPLWRHLILVGALSSILNSVGQSYLMTDFLDKLALVKLALTFGVGDIIGLLVTTFALMLIFRWVRLYEDLSSD